MKNKSMVKEMFLLTTKPILYVANVSEEQLENAEQDENLQKSKTVCSRRRSRGCSIMCKMEEELSGLDDEDKKEMLAMYNLDESGLDKVVKKSYDLLGLMSFLTAGEPEVRAWTIKKRNKGTGSGR